MLTGCRSDVDFGRVHTAAQDTTRERLFLVWRALTSSYDWSKTGLSPVHQCTFDRDTSEVRLTPPITSVYGSQNGVSQCVHAGSICVTCVHVHQNTTKANPKSENMTENFERVFFLKKDVLRSIFGDPFSVQFSPTNCQQQLQQRLRLGLGLA